MWGSSSGLMPQPVSWTATTTPFSVTPGRAVYRPAAETQEVAIPDHPADRVKLLAPRHQVEIALNTKYGSDAFI